jgi:hypothetical protein
MDAVTVPEFYSSSGLALSRNLGDLLLNERAGLHSFSRYTYLFAEQSKLSKYLYIDLVCSFI